MKVESVSPNGHTVTKPVLHDLNPHTKSYTFKEPRGLIFSTQFAQPAITILEKATFEDMRAKGLIQEGATFAGHSLGEYGALSALAEFMPFRLLMDVVFYRGLAMQMAMDRDERGETDYSMVAVNPSRVGKSKSCLSIPATDFYDSSISSIVCLQSSPAFDETAVRRITHMIAAESKQLLEIVNFNVEGEQYVCAGHVSLAL